ncbi:MAG: type II toxin-antitoxin system death-on-curing family toxin [Moorea sp. SIO1F2]|uniref:type II toxin-antitoxin system death-on-curing family toxin n=1 Tax=unclassified Moorena TaxID=2683338 RepID=UPI0013BC1199|nr:MULTISPECIES: type II toxin-antitoxin system death-on-curing family toxin [unclassified Moorena]NEO15180.1 type II toxin-antitoxin system death-on-curing family toxin [Moorena sp. SIO3E8]NEQ01453.1 type II toxin-antitoxin system death-on-curing family toxin [Moorena sp. SIO3F7]NET82836.1 type II toxin-antitoxin system death-on-curing family toxin [Moorena sp. SIO1F2]
MKEPRWVPEQAVIAIHDELIVEHGGCFGLRDPNLLSSSLARPQHLFAYSDSASLFDIAAAYAFGLAKNHPFVDGNKRIALAVIDVFLRLNGYELVAAEEEAVIKINNLVEGIENQESIATWIAANSQEL